MKKAYHVTYFYLASGMEGNPDIVDYGIIWAESKQEAINIVGKSRSPNEPREYYRNWGLSAKELWTKLTIFKLLKSNLLKSFVKITILLWYRVWKFLGFLKKCIVSVLLGGRWLILPNNIIAG